MKRILIVFTNASTRTGSGMNFDLTTTEKERLNKAATRIKGLVPELGNTLAVAEYPSFAMQAAYVISENPEIECRISSFISLEGFLNFSREFEEKEKEELDTLIVSCLSYYPGKRDGNDFFGNYFPTWWNRSCALFGMPTIPVHDRGGEEALLLIDLVDKTACWFNNIGGEVAEKDVVMMP